MYFDSEYYKKGARRIFIISLFTCLASGVILSVIVDLNDLFRYQKVEVPYKAIVVSYERSDMLYYPRVAIEYQGGTTSFTSSRGWIVPLFKVGDSVVIVSKKEPLLNGSYSLISYHIDSFLLLYAFSIVQSILALMLLCGLTDFVYKTRPVKDVRDQGS